MTGLWSKGHSRTLAHAGILYRLRADEPGYETPEEAVLADFNAPLRYITILGSRVRGDKVTVWMLTNDRPPFEEYTCVCFRENGRWTEAFGSNGLGDSQPREVRAEAERVRSRFR